MQLRRLGTSGIAVSRLSVGTAELGQVYGIQSGQHAGQPDRRTSARVLEVAHGSGVNLFDTAPSYGCSEDLLGEVFPGGTDPIIATKVNIPPANLDSRQFVRQSLESSCEKLHRSSLEIVAIHNATEDTFSDRALIEELLSAKRDGLIRLLGASVYGPQDAMAAVGSGVIDVIQVAYSILDQRMDDGVLAAARRNGIGIISRSVYLKGVLTDRALHLPERCSRLREAAERVIRTLELRSWSDLPRISLRFALSNEMIGSVLVGVSSPSELDFALRCEEEGPLDDDVLQVARSCRLDDQHWLNPSNWGIP